MYSTEGADGVQEVRYFDRAELFKSTASSSRVPLTGAWLTQGSTLIAQNLAQKELDFIILDGQHGYLDETLIGPMLIAMAPYAPIPLVRVPWNDPATVMKTLDAGALGVIAPMINSQEECESFVRACRYAPRGYRSWGPTRLSAFDSGAADPERANSILTLAMVETVQAANAIEEIVAVEGLDGIFVGPADLAMTYGYSPFDQRNDEIVSVLTRIVTACKANGVLAGIAPLSLDDARVAAEIGFDFMSVGSDLSFMGIGASSVAAQVADFGQRSVRGN